mgnify:CR=1 FL=1
MSPEEKYHTDPSYRHLADTVEALIHRAEFTPSEIREACMLGCIHYEQKRIHTYFIDEAAGIALDQLEKFAKTAISRRRGCATGTDDTSS